MSLDKNSIEGWHQVKYLLEKTKEANQQISYFPSIEAYRKGKKIGS